MKIRIKTLYILTICAIIAYLCTQTHWLYTRYELSLNECEDNVTRELTEVMAGYRKLRVADSENKLKNAAIEYQSSISGKIDTTLYQKASTMVTISDSSKTVIKEFDVENAPKDKDVMNPLHDVVLEMSSPFSAEILDSLLHIKRIVADVTLTTTDTMLWNPIMTRHTSIIRPKMSLTSSYDVLEKKLVCITYRIPVSTVLSHMLEALLFSIVLSTLLIICLIWQFATVLRLNRTDKIRSNFITAMIHELKRPISTLKMCVSGIADKRMAGDAATKDELLTETRAALDTLSAYFSKLRDITFNDAEQIPLNITSFSLRQLVAETIGKTHIPYGKTVMLHDISTADITIKADRMHMSNILDNLIENAIKYSGPAVDIDIDYRSTDTHVAITVNDNGFGISQADCRHIFDRFFRGGNTADTLPGMGLGLTYVKMLSEAHGGKVSVDSRTNYGSTFYVSIPQ